MAEKINEVIMAEKMKIRLLIKEDGLEVFSPLGKKSICSINRDDDSAEAVEKILTALGFDVELVDE